MSQTKLSLNKNYCELIFTKGGEGNVKGAKELADIVGKCGGIVD